MLLPYFKQNIIEAGCDEAGRGCLAGPVYAAAVILPESFHHPLLNDSKQLTQKERYDLRPVIEQEAVAFAVTALCNKKIDKYNILQAAIRAMHLSLQKLQVQPQHIIIDGNYFRKYKRIPHTCIIGGDGAYASIAAASILAKTYRDDFMKLLHNKFPKYNWNSNKGYATPDHRAALNEYGPSKFHRQSFRLDYRQPVLSQTEEAAVVEG